VSTFSDELTASMTTLMSTAWVESTSDIFPKTADVALRDGAVRIEAAYLYADMAQSTLLQKSFKDWFAAKVIRMYLAGASRIIRNNGGSIKSFDGDRVMGVFVGGRKRNDAARTALQINWLVQLSINPIVAERLKDSKTKWKVTHGVGIGVGEAFVTRAGVRNVSGETTHNDLISIGRAPNVAAKLSAVRDPGLGPLLITSDVFSMLDGSQKEGGVPTQSMWTGPHHVDVGPYSINVHSSTWRSQP